MELTNYFDVIVIGAGHAGIEAAYAAARLGSKTLLITTHIDRIGLMSCNPAIGGIGKSHLVFEVSALGGLMPQLCSTSYLQARMLNTRKGPAVHGLRLQIDKYEYQTQAKQALARISNLEIIAGTVTELLTDLTNTSITGVKTREGGIYKACAVVVTTGTFLNGMIHHGSITYPGGRHAEEASTHLADSLRRLGLKTARLKTGTPARLARSSLDFSAMEKQEAHNPGFLFEPRDHDAVTRMDCYITHTTQETHDIIRNNLHQSAMYSGNITGKPPRYCPSIEDKITRFADKLSHHVFIEPESVSSDEMYPNGISTSLPLDIQEQFIRTISGCAQARITRPAYAIEYDYIQPTQLEHSLQTKEIAGLFCAGQINGTTGYEEAAAQGVIAGINAHHYVAKKPFYIIDRTKGYIGVMIDDLVTLGTQEPYRMFTARAERRLILRQDNAFYRLNQDAYVLGLIGSNRYSDIAREQELVQELSNKILKSVDYKNITQYFAQGNVEEIYTIIKQQTLELLSKRVQVAIFAELLYAPYQDRELREIERTRRYQHLSLMGNQLYDSIPGLCKELQEKLTQIKPATVAQAMLIDGMTPAAISLLVSIARDQYSGMQ
jgi:tRNA uridine 5-carboxymethylaminomethyl modification enzyme